MRWLISITSAVFILSALSISVVQMGGLPDACAAVVRPAHSLERQTDTLLVDAHNGVSLAQSRRTTPPYEQSPDGAYRVTLLPDRDDVIIHDHATGSDYHYDGEIITGLMWSDDSQILLITEYMSAIGQTRITGWEAASQSVRYQQLFEAGVRWRRQDRQDIPFLYAQLLLESEERRSGVMFFNTRDGTITRFENPTQFPYQWSASGRYVATSHRVVINIIDPMTGHFHPNFREPMIGDDFIWQGDDALWFMRIEDQTAFTVWRATLANGRIEPMIANARLDAISDDGRWAYVDDQRADDMALIDIAQDARYPLGIKQDGRRPTDYVAFSPDGRCVAILLLDTSEHDHTLLRFDLQKRRLLAPIPIAGDFNTLSWVTSP